MVVDITNSLVRPTNILLTLKENNDDNVTITKQLQNARYAFKRSLKGFTIEMQQLMMLVEPDKYVHWSICIETIEVVECI